jgi:hypothetical protein
MDNNRGGKMSDPELVNNEVKVTELLKENKKEVLLHSRFYVGFPEPGASE